MTPGQSYFIGVDCGNTWGGWLSWSDYTATADPPPTTRAVTFSFRPVALLSTVAKVDVEWSTAANMSNSTISSEVACTSAAVCSVTTDVAIGVVYYRHRFKTSGSVVVTQSKPQAITVAP
jgi:hypothetical protein